MSDLNRLKKVIVRKLRVRHIMTVLLKIRRLKAAGSRTKTMQKKNFHPKVLLPALGHTYVGLWADTNRVGSGDAYYGEHEYGDMYTQALDETGYAYQTLADAKYVSKNYTVSDRSENLPWSFHKVSPRLGWCLFIDYGNLSLSKR